MDETAMSSSCAPTAGDSQWMALYVWNLSTSPTMVPVECVQEGRRMQLGAM